MRILFAIHAYVPIHNCGGEMLFHNIAKFMISKGHEVRVLLFESKEFNVTEVYNYEGVTVFPVGNDKSILLHYLIPYFSRNNGNYITKKGSKIYG